MMAECYYKRKYTHIKLQKKILYLGLHLWRVLLRINLLGLGILSLRLKLCVLGLGNCIPDCKGILTHSKKESLGGRELLGEGFLGRGTAFGISRIFSGKKIFSTLLSLESVGTPAQSIVIPHDSVQ